MARKLNAELTKQIRNELQFRETADLAEIWQTNDRDEWTGEAFEAVHSLLVERLGPIPPQSQSASWALGLQIRAQPHLDQARKYEAQGKFEKALAECEAAIRIAPQLGAAHHYRGLLLDSRGRVLEAMAAYQEAIRVDRNLIEARENLREAEHEWLDEDSPDRPPLDPTAPADELLNSDYIVVSGDLPEEFYLSETARMLPGWPGYRTRPGRSGYDYLDTSYEAAHMEGVFLRQLVTGKLRTNSFVGLLSLLTIALVAELSLLLGVLGILSGQFFYLIFILIYSVCWVPGLMLLWNVVRNFRELLSDQ